MDTADSHIEILISKIITGEATPSEVKELDFLMASHKDIRKRFEENKDTWEKSRHPFSAEEIQADRKKIKEQITRKTFVIREQEKEFRLFFRVAATLAVPVLLVIGWYAGNRSLFNRQHILCEVSAPKGQIAECLLADGTRVWLNAGTTIQYDPLLRGKNRLVNLTGEAYFEVTKNQHKPFIVNTSEIQVKVLGTSFDVRAYPDENKTETTLEKGQISLSFNNYPKQPSVFLKPGEYAIFQPVGKSFKIEKTDTSLHTSWRTGKYIFKDADLKTIVQQLEKLYDVRIHLGNRDMEQSRFRGTFEYNQNIFDALETIERATSFKYRINGRDIWLEE
jgi:ferric-dicitrate binding protein FerR (iron transport regulator)